MKIDNRIFIPIVMPFVMLGIIRLMWWVSGAEWTQPGLWAAVCLIFGGVGGLLAVCIMFDRRIDIGATTIRRRK